MMTPRSVLDIGVACVAAVVCTAIFGSFMFALGHFVTKLW